MLGFAPLYHRVCNHITSSTHVQLLSPNHFCTTNGHKHKLVVNFSNIICTIFWTRHLGSHFADVLLPLFGITYILISCLISRSTVSALFFHRKLLMNGSQWVWRKEDVREHIPTYHMAYTWPLIFTCSVCCALINILFFDVYKWIGVVDQDIFERHLGML